MGVKLTKQTDWSTKRLAEALLGKRGFQSWYDHSGAFSAPGNYYLRCLYCNGESERGSLDLRSDASPKPTTIEHQKSCPIALALRTIGEPVRINPKGDDNSEEFLNSILDGLPHGEYGAEGR